MILFTDKIYFCLECNLEFDILTHKYTVCFIKYCDQDLGFCSISCRLKDPELCDIVVLHKSTKALINDQEDFCRSLNCSWIYVPSLS